MEKNNAIQGLGTMLSNPSTLLHECYVACYVLIQRVAEQPITFDSDPRGTLDQ